MSEDSPKVITLEAHDHEIGKLIDEREAAEQTLSHAFYLITGRPAEWSNLFGYSEALEEIDDAQRLLRLAATPIQSRRADPVREELEQAPPMTAPHPSRLYRKKPVAVEAVQWTGGIFRSLEEPWRSLIAPRYGGAVYQAGDNLCVETLEGKMIASPGDWIICGVKRELYPCKPDIFAASYEPWIAPTNEMGAERSAASPSSDHPRTGSPKESA